MAVLTMHGVRAPSTADGRAAVGLCRRQRLHRRRGTYSHVTSARSRNLFRRPVFAWLACAEQPSAINRLRLVPVVLDLVQVWTRPRWRWKVALPN